MKKFIAATALLVFGFGSAVHADDAKSDADNMVKVDRAAFKETFVNPDVDLKQYTKIMIADGEYEFRDVKKTPRMSSTFRNNTSEFWVSDSDKEKAQAMINDTFDDEFAKIKNFEIVTEPGPGVLILHGGLYDIVSHVPPEPMGAGESYISKVATATISLEAVDAVTGEVVFNASERSKIERGGRDMIAANSVTVRAEVRRWARRNAAKLVKALDSIH